MRTTAYNVCSLRSVRELLLLVTWILPQLRNLWFRFVSFVRSFVHSIIYSFRCYLCVFGWHLSYFHEFSFVTVKSKAIFVVISLPSLSLLTANFMCDLDIIHTWLCDAHSFPVLILLFYPSQSVFTSSHTINPSSIEKLFRFWIFCRLYKITDCIERFRE